MENTPRSDLLDYLAEANRNGTPIPTIAELSGELGMSITSLREQLEVARRLGFVTIKPKTGIQPCGFSLAPALRLSLQYGIRVQPELFEAFRDLRKHIEASYWFEAAPILTSAEVSTLGDIVRKAQSKIKKQPIESPEKEHRAFHLAIFQHLENPVVKSLLETYWDLNAGNERNYYIDQNYLEIVWNYHQRIVEALAARDFERGHQALLAHMDLVMQRKKAELSQRFE
jgi:DNA-binding FadR family transcriptional regulator